MTIDFKPQMPITQFFAILQLYIYMKAFIFIFQRWNYMSSSLHKKFRFFWEFLKKKWRKPHQIENQLKKSENFTMCILQWKQHGVNPIFMSLYDKNSIHIEITFKVQIAIKYSILGIFSKLKFE